MGIQLGLQVQPNLINMKAFVALFALAATALAESDPWYGYGYGYGLAHPYTLGYGCHNAYGAPVPCAGRKKREADPAVLLHHPYAYGAYGYGYAAPAIGATVAVKPCTNVDGEKVDCALGHKDVATAHIVPAVYGRKKRAADPVYFRNVKAEVTEHEGKHVVPTLGYAAGVYGPPVENPTNPDEPELVHTSQLGICLNAYGFQVPCQKSFNEKIINIQPKN